MNVLPGLLIVLCLIAFVSAEGHRSRSRPIYKVFKQRRLNPDELGRRENYRDKIFLTTHTTGTGTPTVTDTPITTTHRLSNKKKNMKELEYDQLVNSFDHKDIDELYARAPTTTTVPSTTTTTSTTTSTTPPTPPTSTPAFLSNKEKKTEELEYDQLVNSFDQRDIDDIIEKQKPRKKKNRRPSSRRHHHHRQ